MEPTKHVLKELLNHIAALNKEVVDDPEETLNELAINSSRYIEALKAAIEKFK
jgi:hypothetical protein